MVGTTILHYEIQAMLGEGGMGVVYKAFDQRLNRPVALKVLRPDAVSDPGRRQRFVQEARAASALNHPYIVTVYDITSADGTDFIAMEYVSGKPLDQVIGRTGLPLAQDLRYGIQIADALTTAHQAGIVHRELKPGNIVVTDRGDVKLLDFGLAKLAARLDVDSSAATFTQGVHTEEGTILGTAAYMSPEQAEGKTVDARSDIFSFGSVLYEMATGRRAFQGTSTVSTLAAILHHQPTPVREIVPVAPPDLDRLIARCLRKDPDRRIQHMDDVKLALEELKEESGAGMTVPVSPLVRRRPARASLAVGAVILLLVGAGLTSGLWQRRESPDVARRAEAVLKPITADTGLSFDPALSPDGKLLAYASDRSGEGHLDIRVQQVGGGEPVRLTRHEADDYEPSFSPDGTLTDAAKTFIVPAGGGAPRQSAPEFLEAHQPVFPDGTRLLFAGNRDAPGRYTDDWYIAPLDGGPVRGVGAEGHLRRAGLSGPYGHPLAGIRPEVSPRGDAVIFSATHGASSNLWQIRLAPDSGQLSGPPEQLTFLASGAGLSLQPSVARAGDGLRIAFWNVAANMDVWSLALDHTHGKALGSPVRLTRNAAVEQWASLSGDGKRMTYNLRTSEDWDVWLMDLETGRQAPLAAGSAYEMWPRITRDGRTVAYAVESPGKPEIHALTIGSAVPEKMCEGCTEPWDWSSDGQSLLYRSGLPRKVGVLRRGSSGTVVLAHPDYNVQSPRFSPDDGWILVTGLPGPRTGIEGSVLFVAPFRGDAVIPLAEWQVVADRPPYNVAAGWSPDGSLVYFMSGRDGFRCLWAQRLQPTTMRPEGEPFEVQPFHRPQIRSMALWEPGAAGTAVARDRFVFSMVEATGNIWMAEVR